MAQVERKFIVDGAVDFTKVDGTIALKSELDAEATSRAAGDAAEASSRAAAILAESSAREAADSTLQANIDAEATARASADTTLQVNINAEASARAAAILAESSSRAAADSTLQANIDAESSSRAAAGSTLQANIDAEASSRAAAILAESSAREAADSTLQANIDAEATARVAADSTLQSNINAEASSRAAAILAESSSRAAADSTLQANIDAEASARIAADDGLQQDIADTVTNFDLALNQEISDRQDADNALAGDIATETSRALAAEEALDGKLDQEIFDRSEGDTLLNNAIVAEASSRAAAILAESSSRAAADSTLQANIDAEASSRAAAILAEASSRSAADSTLQANIDAEATARANADSTLQSNINAESSSRAAADSTLQANIDAEASARALADSAESSSRAAAILAESSSRAAADSTLQANIDAEATARANADSTLQSNIDAEATARANEDLTFLKLDGSRMMTGALDMNGFKITDLANPENAQDAASKYYVDNLVAGLSWKQAVHAATAGNNKALSGVAPLLVDGHTLNDQERVLLKDQTNPAENGIYVVTYSGGNYTLARSADMNSWAEVIGAVVYVQQGGTNAGAKFVSSNTAGGTLEVTAITFVVFSAASALEGVGAAGQNAYWTGSNTIAGEPHVAASRGGLGADASVFDGVLKFASGVASAASIVDADVDSSAAIAYSKLNLAGSVVVSDLNINANLSMNSNKLESLSDGTVSSDAVNLGQLQSAVGSEASAREAAIIAEASSREAAIIAEASSRSAADSTLQSNIDAEATARANADSTLQSNIDAEATARASADSTLQANIDAEASARGAAILAEASSRSAADSTLQANIDAEATARAAGDAAEASSRAAAILAEASAREAAILAEASSRSAADSTLQANIDAEATSRALADSALDVRVTALEDFAIAQTIYVAKSGSDTTGTGGQHRPYLTLTKAFSMITDASPTKRYAVRVAAGAYTEASVALPSNVFVIGEQKEAVRITGAVSMGAWTQNNSGSDDRSGFSMVTLLSAANFNWDTAKSRAGKLYMNEVVFGSTVNLYGYDNAIAQAQFDACIIFGALTISGINIGAFNSNICFNNVTLNQHPNGGMASVLVASGGYCSGTVRFNTTVNDFNRRCSSFLRAFPSENLIVDGPSSYADVDLVSQGKSSTQQLNGGNLVALNPRINHDIETKMIKPLATNSHNLGDWGKQWMFNFGYVHASSGTDLYLSSVDSSYDPAGSAAGYSVYVEADGYGLKPNVNGGDINVKTATPSGIGVRGKIKLDGREIDASSVKITNLANGSAANDAVNKSQLDAEASSLSAAVVAEASSREAADLAEASSREAADLAEASSRAAADSALDLRLDVVEERDDYLLGSLYNSSAAVYADGQPGSEDPSATTRDGWYYQNSVGGQKINWYFFDGTSAATGANISLGNFSAYAIASFDSLASGPILSVYTLPTGSGDVMPGFAHSKVAYSASLTGKVLGKKYLVYFGQNPSIHPELERIELIKSTGSSAGDQNPAEQVFTVSYGSDSGASVNNVKMMVESLGVYSPNYKSLVSLKIRAATKAALDAEISSRQAADSTLQANIDALSGSVAASALVPMKDNFTLSGADVINQYINLSHLAVAHSINLVIDGLVHREGVDYTLSAVGGVTRITLAGDLASGGQSALVAGDEVQVQYMYLHG